MQLVNQLLLPLVLAFMMFIVGTGMQLSSVKTLAKQPKVAFIGLASQLFLLPSVAWLLIIIFKLPVILAAGLVLVASAPGGATSNMFTFLTKGDLPLSIALTALLSLIAPFWLPWFIQTQFSYLGFSASFNLSLAVTVKQLLVVTIFPLSLGWIAAYFLPNFFKKIESKLKLAGILTLVTLLVILIIMNRNHLAASLQPINILMVILLATLALGAGFLVAKLFRLNLSQAKTLAFETGVQNAALAMLIAFSFLNLPELGFLALAYGLLMNIPAFTLVFIFNRLDKKQELADASSNPL